jgi:hypothetical protein
MSVVQVRTHDDQPIPADAEYVLDDFGPINASTVQVGGDLLQGLNPPPVASDLLRLGGAVYCADKIILRCTTADQWTREIELEVPVSDRDLWAQASDDLCRALDFLSGDHWRLSFVVDDRDRVDTEQLPVDDRDAVCLFSGGLDSLTGAIDGIAGGKKFLLVGHYESGLPHKKQELLANALRGHFGDTKAALRQLHLRPHPPHADQARPLSSTHEITTRARSLLFLAAGLAVASSLGEDCPLVVPENGFIGINVPLIGSRVGSLSTRTTHPHFMTTLRRVLDRLGIENPIENPYRLKTKGEALESCADGAFLRNMAGESFSCSHPEANRWRKKEQGDCGYCYPCLIRRAAMYRIGEDRAGDYAWDVLTDTDVIDSNWEKTSASIRALAANLRRGIEHSDILRNGPIPAGEIQDFLEVYERGRSELRQWIDDGGGAQLRALVT